MAELSEKQLLLLDNLMYYSGSKVAPEERKTVEAIATKMLADAEKSSKFSGGFEKQPEQVREIANAILKDQQLCSLTATESVNINAVRATCFRGDNMSDAVVAIRGTGGSYEAWSDNVFGAFQTDSKCQETIGEFVSGLGKKGYSELTITGHSKGGNMAQYSTITQGNLIDRCVSFDGQAFSSDFLRDYGTEISRHSSKIKSISGDYDYVNILGNSISDKNSVYLHTKMLENPHSSYALWAANKNETGKTFHNTVMQSRAMTVADCVTDKLLSDIRKLNPKYEAVVTGFLAFSAGAIFGDKSPEELMKFFKEYLSDCHLKPQEIDLLMQWAKDEIKVIGKYLLSPEFFREYKRRRSIMARNVPRSNRAASAAVNSRREKPRRVMGDHKRRSSGAPSRGGKAANININIATAKAACGELVTIGKNLESIQSEVTELTGELLVQDSAYAILKKKLVQINGSIGKEAKRIDKIGEAGIECMQLYASTEKSIVGMK